MANNPIPAGRKQKFTGGGADGTFRGAYSALKSDPTFTKPASPDSFESSGVVGSADVPDVGGVNDGRGSPNR